MYYMCRESSLQALKMSLTDKYIEKKNKAQINIFRDKKKAQTNVLIRKRKSR